MVNDSKYRKNRNNWAKTYPPRRTKPTPLQFVANNRTSSLDRSRYFRARDYFELEVPVSSSAISAGPDPFPPWVNCPGAFMYNAAVSSDIIEVGSGVDTWNEFSGGLDFRQTTDSLRPQYDGSRYVNFDRQYYMDLDSGANQWDFLKESGGTIVALWRTTGTFGFGIGDGHIYSSYDGIFTRGSQLRVFSSSPGTINFGLTVGTAFLATEDFSPTFVDTTSGSNHIIIGRFVSGSVSGVSFSPNAIAIRVDGDWADNANPWTSWNDTDSGFTPRLGANQSAGANLAGEIAIFVACPTVLTDEQCGDIEQWAQANYNVQLTSSIGGLPAPT